MERKNGWQLAEAAGDAQPHRMQRLLNNARWDPRDVRVDLRDMWSSSWVIRAMY
ncbi:hypothetical protein HD597_000788 [Nonomuraea thailandensis]|uniref:Uncharacterized protein n=1 Tax=Nonomuraea thailandensis TaxID=1188745 RepID=A0A9X2JYF7_9ACTN|nr:hypothetical protein [Nonomuraea thailandensis]MCP2353768.1 hypothetical protein [Nonomuraea thailandensis]